MMAIHMMIAALMVAQSSGSGQSNRPTAERADPGGFWPTHKLMESLVGRWAEMVSERYELDDQQQKDLVAQMQRRWMRFADDNEKALKPLLNEYIEMRLQMEPPTKEQVAEWSQRAGKSFDLFETEINRGADEMKGLLHEDQIPKFEGDVLGFQAGMQFARVQLGRWQRGEYNEQEFWDPPMTVRRARRAEEEAKRAEAEKAKVATAAAEGAAGAEAKGPQDQIVAEVGAWQKYVEDFIARYKLDAAQQKTAKSVLQEMRERALSHRDANKVEIDRLEERIAAGSKTKEESDAIEKELTRLYGPIDALFDELKRRLEPIPTAEQKAAAAKREAEAKTQQSGKSSEAKKPVGGDQPIDDGKEVEDDKPSGGNKPADGSTSPPAEKKPAGGKEPKKKT